MIVPSRAASSMLADIETQFHPCIGTGLRLAARNAVSAVRDWLGIAL
jgi:hypothetical protein